MVFDFFEQPMVEITLSFFDIILGPRVITGLPWYNKKNRNQFISEYFDFHKPGDFFCHIYAENLSFNYLFEFDRLENERGGKRCYMMTTSIPFILLKRKDLLQYYSSLELLFHDWKDDLKSIPNLNGLIHDGDYESEFSLQPILFKLSNYLGELQFIINVMPDTVTIPINMVPKKEK